MQAINYISSVGQNTDARYPYTSSSGTTGSCKTTTVPFPSGGGVQMSGKAQLVSPQNDERTLLNAVATAPTTVYFDVENSFQNYAGGVYKGTDCGANTNHASECRGNQMHAFDW